MIHWIPLAQHSVQLQETEPTRFLQEPRQLLERIAYDR
jgi:hypothetical protein